MSKYIAMPVLSNAALREAMMARLMEQTLPLTSSVLINFGTPVVAKDERFCTT